MASTYSARLRVELQADGENDTTWGQKANESLKRLEDAIADYQAVNVGGAADVTLTANNGTTDQARAAIIEFTGVLTGNINVIVPTAEKWWFFVNNTTGAFTLKVKTAAGTGIFVTQGKTAILYCDGTNVLSVLDGSTIDNPTSYTPVLTVNAQTGTTYTFLDTDRSKLVTFSNASAIAGTLPQAGAASQFIANWFMVVQNRGAGALTITPSTSTIDGAASLTLNQGEGVIIASDGSNYFTSRGQVADASVTPAKLSGAAAAYDFPVVAGFSSAWALQDIAVQSYGIWTCGRDITFVDEIAGIGTAPVGTALIFDLLKNGTTIYSSKPQFASGSSTLTPGVLSTTTAAAGDKLEFKVTQIGSTTAGQGLRPTFRAKVR